MSDRQRPEPRPMTVGALRQSLGGLPDDAVVLFELPNGKAVDVRSARHTLATTVRVDRPQDWQSEPLRAILLKG